MDETATLLSRWVNFEVAALEAAGFKASAYLRANGHPVHQEPGWARTPWAPVAAMWKAAERSTRDPNLGLHAGLKASLEQPGFIAYAMLSGAHLRETFGFLEEYQRLCIDGRVVSLERRGRDDAICLHPDLQPPPSKHHAEFLFVLFLRAGRHILGAEFAPSSVRLRRTVSSKASEYPAAFGCPVYWDQSADELRIEAKWMTKPSPFSDPDTMKSLRERAAQFLKQYTAPDWMERVTALVQRLLPEGAATIEGVAENLGISTRTLQRRLADEGKSFDSIRESVRRSLALELVGRDRMKVKDVASRLGFSDPRAFRRAFQRWTGTTPSASARLDEPPKRSRKTK